MPVTDKWRRWRHSCRNGWALNALSEELGVAFGSVRTWVEALGRLYYLFDFSEIADPGARFENLVALHLLKLCHAWNDWGLGDYELHSQLAESLQIRPVFPPSRRPLVLDEGGPAHIIHGVAAQGPLLAARPYFIGREPVQESQQVDAHGRITQLDDLAGKNVLLDERRSLEAEIRDSPEQSAGIFGGRPYPEIHVAGVSWTSQESQVKGAYDHELNVTAVEGRDEVREVGMDFHAGRPLTWTA